MPDVNIAPGPDAPAFVMETVPVADHSPVNARDAAASLTDWRNKRDAKASEPETPETPAAPEAAASEPEPTAAPAEEATSETPTETQPEPAQPTIEPPRSWTKEEKEEFSTYPREAQEKIARREQDRETALRRGQNEVAEQRKAMEADRLKVEDARKQYEQALPTLLQALEQQQQGEFSDIKTMEDVTKLAREDWPRYALWDAQQKKIAAVTQEAKSAQERQATQYKTQWAEFANKEDAKFLELAPEMADKAVATKVADASVALLKDKGFTESDLAKLWSGEASLSLRDHRAQLLIRDAVKYREAQASARRVAAKPIPPVQKPGTSQSRASDDDVQVKNLEQKLNSSENWKDAAALLMAKRAARR